MATMKKKAFTAEQDRVLLAVAKRPHANGQALYEAYIAESGDTVHGLGATATRLHGILSWSHDAMDPALKIDLVRRARVEYARRTGRANGQAGTDVVVDGREWITAGAAAAILGVHPRSVNNLDIDRRGDIHPLHRKETRMMYARDGVVALAERRKSETREEVAAGELPGLSAAPETLPPAVAQAPESLPRRGGLPLWPAGYVETAPGEVTLHGEPCVTPWWVAKRAGLDPRAIGATYGRFLEQRAHPTNIAHKFYTRDSVERLLEELAKQRTTPAAPTQPGAPFTMPRFDAPPPAPTRSLAERLDVLNLALAAGDLTLEEHRAKVRAAVGA